MKDIRSRYREMVAQVPPEIKEEINLSFAISNKINSLMKERGLSTSSRKRIKDFSDTLAACGVNATVRRRLGPDINASCGQLRRRELEGKSKE